MSVTTTVNATTQLTVSGDIELGLGTPVTYVATWSPTAGPTVPLGQITQPDGPFSLPPVTVPARPGNVTWLATDTITATGTVAVP